MPAMPVSFYKNIRLRRLCYCSKQPFELPISDRLNGRIRDGDIGAEDEEDNVELW